MRPFLYMEGEASPWLQPLWVFRAPPLRASDASPQRPAFFSIPLGIYYADYVGWYTKLLDMVALMIFSFALNRCCSALIKRAMYSIIFVFRGIPMFFVVVWFGTIAIDGDGYI